MLSLYMSIAGGVSWQEVRLGGRGGIRFGRAGNEGVETKEGFYGDILGGYRV